MCGFRDDHFVLDKQLGSPSLGEANFPSLSSHSLSVDLCLVLGTPRNSPFHVIDVVLGQILFTQPFLGETVLYLGILALCLLMLSLVRSYLHSHFWEGQFCSRHRGILALTIFLPIIHNVP